MAVEFGSGLRLGGRIIPTDGTMRIAVNYRGPARSFRTFSFGDLVVGRIPKGTFTGKLVLVGATALGVGDTFPSPFDEALPGVEYLATVIDNLRQGDALNHSQETAVLDLLILVALGLLFALLAALRQPTATLIAGAAIAAAVTVGNYLAFAEGNLWLNLTFPLASVVLCTAVLGFTNVMTAQREKAVAVRQRGAMSQYVAPWIADRVTSGEDTAAFPRALQAAVLFVDMRGFTALSESRGSAATAHLLHDYHRLVEEVVARHDGTIDKFMGDGAMALFGVPEPGERDPLNALACARDLAEALAQWGSAAEGAPIGFGIGLHFGPVAVDQTGGQRQLHLSVSGDTVNVASRLESLSATHGAAIIASDALMDMAEAQGAGALLAGFTRLPMQTVKGRERPIGVWALTAAGRPEEP
jgi:adenylate cyclase